MKLDQNQIIQRNNWFKLVFFPLCKDVLSFTQIQQSTEHGITVLTAAAKKLKEAIIELKFLNVDNELSDLSDITAVNDVAISATATDIANYIASFCQEKEIYFDDYISPKYTTYEIEAFKNTILGSALVNFECFISQDPALQVQQPQPSRTSRSSGGSNSGKPNIANCYGLVDKTKIQIFGTLYWIGGEFLNTNGKTAPRIHVKPLRRPASGNNLEVFTNGSGQGYEDCVLFWAKQQEAEEVAQVIDETKHGSKVKDYQVKRQGANGNEYYKVNTEFGPAYIKADRLVEMVECYNKKFKEDLNSFLKSLD